MVEIAGPQVCLPAARRRVGRWRSLANGAARAARDADAPGRRVQHAPNDAPSRALLTVERARPWPRYVFGACTAVGAASVVAAWLVHITFAGHTSRAVLIRRRDADPCRPHGPCRRPAPPIPVCSGTRMTVAAWCVSCVRRRAPRLARDQLQGTRRNELTLLRWSGPFCRAPRV